MRIKTIVVAAAALFAALSSQAAEPWFSVDFGDPDLTTWPSADWSNTENTSFDKAKGVLKLDSANELTYAAGEKQLVSTKIATVTTTMKFTAYEENDFPAVLNGSKAGVIVMETGSSLAYYGLAKVGSTNTWVQLTGATPTEDAAVQVNMLLKGDKVQYKIGETVLTNNSESWLDVVSNGTVSEMVYCGTGEISYLSGQIDNAPVEVALAWPTGYTAVSYQVGENDPVTISGTSASPYTVKNLAAGDVVTFTFQNADGATKTLTATAGTDSEIDASDATFVWADYLGEAVNGAYTIDDANDLDMLRAGVASGLLTANVTFKQTANIDMSTAGAFAGIGTYNVTVANGVSFSGTYDGQGFKISNISLAAANYAGIFNQVDGGTIKNLTVENISGSKGISIVGHAANGTTLQGLTATGSFGTAESPATHNAAGIVVRIGGGAAADTVTTIQSCTNNATIYGTYSKIGGIAALVQGSDAANKSGKVMFEGCVNNGSIVRIGTATDTNGGFGGILAYATFATELENCVNNGTISATLENAHIGQIVGHYQAYGLTDIGGNAGSSNSPLLGTVMTTTGLVGFQYATVENGIATTIAGAPVAGGEYLLEGNAAPVIELDDGETVAFDTALGYTLDDTGITAAEGLEVTSATVGTVTTYTAVVPVPKVAAIGSVQFETLAEALEAAVDGDTITILANIAVTEMQLVTKSVTLDLNGYAITAGDRTAEAATAGDDSILCVLHGGSLTINDSSAGGTGAITGNSVFTSAVKMTKKGDTDDTKKAVLVVNGGTLTGYYYGISGNGLAGRGNTEVTINGGSVYGTCVNDSVAIFQPQLGTLTINGGYLEGAMGVYVKSGTATVAINGGTIKGNGTYAAYVPSTNGFNNTGDAFVVDNAGYPGGAPAPSILGGTFVSVNASAIASYAKTGLERIVHFADKDAVTITEAKASSEDVFLEKGFPGGKDGKTFTIDSDVQAALEEKLAGKALTETVEGTTSGLTYAQAYALGLFDEKTGTVEDIKPTIEIKDGKVVVSLDATAKTGYKVMLNVYQKASLTAQWPTEPTKSYELDSAAEAVGFDPSAGGSGFYKVGVTIEDAE